jgi:hypothetical protein
MGLVAGRGRTYVAPNRRVRGWGPIRLFALLASPAACTQPRTAWVPRPTTQRSLLARLPQELLSIQITPSTPSVLSIYILILIYVRGSMTHCYEYFFEFITYR